MDDEPTMHGPWAETPDSEPPEEPPEEAPEEATAGAGSSRRDLLGGAVGAAGLAATAGFWLDGFLAQQGPPVQATPPGAPGQTFNQQEWRTLEAACDRLLPSEGAASPGARDVNAIGYMDARLTQAGVKPTWIPVLKSGAATLDGYARRLRATDFAALAPARQDEVIKRFEAVVDKGGKKPGHKWLRVMLSNILEAFFCDPARGGNPNEIAWKWAEHRPGFPRPPTKGWMPKERGA